MKTTNMNFITLKERWGAVQSAKVLSLLFIAAAVLFTSCKKDKKPATPVLSVNQGIVSTLAGSGTPGWKDETGLNAQFKNPNGVAVDKDGYVYVADSDNHRIRKISPLGLVSTLAGSGTPGWKDEPGLNAQFDSPRGVAVDKNGNVYVADWNNHRIRMITPTGVVSTFAGSGVANWKDETGTNAEFNHPSGVAVDKDGYIYVADYLNSIIRKITPAGVVSTLAGEGAITGFKDKPLGQAEPAQFSSPYGVTLDAQGNVYVADQQNHRIRKISPQGVVSTLAGSGTPGWKDEPGTTAQFNAPSAVAVDAEGNVYIADYLNHRIRKVTSAGSVSTLAGSTFGFNDAAGATAKFNLSYGVAVDAQGKVYVGDSGNHRIRKIQ